MARFDLTLEESYYSKGFFNVTIDYAKYVRAQADSIELVLGKSGIVIVARISWTANRNGTPRISPRAALRDWFQRHYAQGDVIELELSSDSIRFPEPRTSGSLAQHKGRN